MIGQNLGTFNVMDAGKTERFKILIQILNKLGLSILIAYKFVALLGTKSFQMLLIIFT